jgi:polysaccharide pyruvyl transferase WcaK-like protein
MKKIYYVSDNRTGVNWGCRATSIALGEYLRTRYTVAATMYNTDKRDAAKQKYLDGSIESAVDHFITKALQDREHQKIIDTISEVDAVVINGEGDMIFSPERKTLKFLLVIMELARAYSKPVYFVNAMVSECPVYGRHPETMTSCLHALKHAAGIGVRDPLSQELIAEIAPDLNVTPTPDALFLWAKKTFINSTEICRHGDIILPAGHDEWFGQYDFSGDYICIGGSSFAKQMATADLINFYIKLVKGLQKLKIKLYLVESSGRDDFLRIVGRHTNTPIIPVGTPIILATQVLANAKVLVSGRYHPSIMAALRGTPLVCLNSNSHKMLGLQHFMGYESPVEHKIKPVNSILKGIVEHTAILSAAEPELRPALARKAVEAASEFPVIMDSLLAGNPLSTQA